MLLCVVPALQRKIDTARKWFTRAVTLDPDNGDAAAARYMFELKAGTPEQVCWCPCLLVHMVTPTSPSCICRDGCCARVARVCVRVCVCVCVRVFVRACALVCVARRRRC